MREEPNVPAFCRELRKEGAKLLDGVDPRLLDFITLELRQTDLCCSESITAVLESEWCFGPEEAVKAALEWWPDVIRDRLDGLFGPDSLFPWKQAGVSDDERGELYYAVETGAIG
jgi:hypothetical protein